MQCEIKHARYGLAEVVRTNFSEITLDLRSSRISSIEYRRLVSQGNPLPKTNDNVSCSLCLIRYASWVMQCSHQFCSACIADLGTETESHVFSLTSCPVCMVSFHESIDITSSLLGLRILKISSLTGSKIISFLSKVCRNTGIQHPTLCFDSIVANGLGEQNFLI